MILHEDGRCYIGSAVDLKNRIREHFNALQKGSHPNKKLQLAWFQSGEEAFSYRIIKRCSTEQLLQHEQRFIEKNNSVNTGFNIAPEAGKVTFGRQYFLRKERRSNRKK